MVEAKATGALATGRSTLDAVAEVHDTVAEPALLQQLQLDAGVAGEWGLPSPTSTGYTKSWHSSTSPALNACAARVGPATLKSLAADVFMSRTESGSKRRSSRVLAVETPGSVVE